MAEIKTVIVPHVANAGARETAVAKIFGGGDAAPTSPEAPAPTPPEAPAPEAPAPTPPEAPAPTPPEAPAPTPPEAPAPTPPNAELQALLDTNRQLVQRMLDQPRPAQQADPTQAEIAEAVRTRDYATLERHGLSMQDWTDQQLAEMTDDPKERELLELRRTVKQLTDWQTQQEQARQQQEKQAQISRVQKIENETKEVIRESLEGDEEARILLAVAGGVEDVYKVIEQHVQYTKRVYGEPKWLDPREAAKVVLQNRGKEVDRLLEVAKEHPNYRQYFAAHAAPAASNTPTPAPSISSSQVQGSAGVAPEDTLATRRERGIAAVEAYLKAGRR